MRNWQKEQLSSVRYDCLLSSAVELGPLTRRTYLETRVSVSLLNTFIPGATHHAWKQWSWEEITVWSSLYPTLVFSPRGFNPAFTQLSTSKWKFHKNLTNKWIENCQHKLFFKRRFRIVRISTGSHAVCWLCVYSAYKGAWSPADIKTLKQTNTGQVQSPTCWLWFRLLLTHLRTQ